MYRMMPSTAVSASVPYRLPFLKMLIRYGYGCARKPYDTMRIRPYAVYSTAYSPNEYGILTHWHVHTLEKVPGVVEAVYHEVIKPPTFCLTREKHRIGLQQAGKDLTSIPTVMQVLEIVFDILEGSLSLIIHTLYAHSFAVLQYLRFKCHVLHRDISIGNVLYVEDDLPTSIGTWTGGVNEVPEAVGPEGLPLCFIKYLLGERCVDAT